MPTDALKAETIIPREVPLEEKNFKDLTLAELRELHRRAKEAKVGYHALLKARTRLKDCRNSRTLGFE